MTLESNDEKTETVLVPTTCPRCGRERGDGDFYGICMGCAIELRATYDGSPRADVAAEEYEPKMNVTPNAVASKE